MSVRKPASQGRWSDPSKRIFTWLGSPSSNGSLVNAAVGGGTVGLGAAGVGKAAVGGIEVSSVVPASLSAAVGKSGWNGVGVEVALG